MNSILKKWGDGIIALILLIVGFLLFSSVFSHAFLQDDYNLIAQNESITSVQNIPLFFVTGPFQIGQVLAGMYYRPLMTVSLALTTVLFGSEPQPFHLVQIILHITNAFLMYMILKKYAARSAAFAFSLLFLVHPINAESVNYMSALADLLFPFFGLLALISLTYVRRSLPILLLTILLLTCSLFSKETGLTFFILGAVYLFLFDKKSVLKYVLISITPIALYFILRHIAVGSELSAQSLFPMMKLNLAQRIAHIPSLIWFYGKTLLFPVHLSSVQIWTMNVSNFSTVILSFIALISAGLIALWSITKRGGESVKDRRALSFFTIWFGIALGIHLQIIPLDFTVAERWFYTPFIALCGVFAILARKMFENKIVIVITAVVFLLLSYRTFVRNQDWIDGYTLAQHDLKTNLNNYLLANTLGYEASQQSDYDEAIRAYELSVTVEPKWWVSRNNLGSAYLKKFTVSGDRHFANKALVAFTQAADLSGSMSLPLDNAAAIYFNFKPLSEQKKFYEKSVRRFPSNARMWFLLGVVEYQLGNKSEAIKSIDRAIAINPTDQYSSIKQTMLSGRSLNVKRSGN